MKVCKNIGNKERAVRILAGTVLISFTFWGPTNPWFLLGAIPLATGLIGWCPPYQIFGINTNRPKTKS